MGDAPRRWWNRIDRSLRSYGLVPTRADRCCYVKYGKAAPAAKTSTQEKLLQRRRLHGKDWYKKVSFATMCSNCSSLAPIDKCQLCQCSTCENCLWEDVNMCNACVTNSVASATDISRKHGTSVPASEAKQSSINKSLHAAEAGQNPDALN